MAPDRERAERDDDFILLYWVLVSYHCPLGGWGVERANADVLSAMNSPNATAPMCVCAR